MVFGRIGARREKHRAQRAVKDLDERQLQDQKTREEMSREDERSVHERIPQEMAKAKEIRQQGRAEGKQYAEDVLSRDVQGLSPKQRNAMQYEANRQIKRASQSANRRLLGEQSRHGIVGRGGVGYAQQRDLERLANEARGQSIRDIDKVDQDLALKKLAAMFNIEQGEASQSQLDRQMAMDQLNLENERKRQRHMENQFERLFSRI